MNIVAWGAQGRPAHRQPVVAKPLTCCNTPK